MPIPFMIVWGVVAGVLLILVAGARFGVSQRAVEAELRRAERQAARHARRAARDDTDLAA